MRPSTTKKNEGNQPRVRYQAIAMAGDENGFYGFVEVIRPLQITAEEAAKSKALAHMQQFFLGSILHRNSETLCKPINGKYASTIEVPNTTPVGYGVHAHALVMKILLLTGIKDCDTKISRGERGHINMAKPMDKAMCNLFL